jgi:glycosyltransferase involved in cell wall biosynthesis
VRIGMFADMYKPHVSGVTNYISMYKNALEERSHDVLVFTFGNRDHHDDEPGIVRSPGIEWGDTGWQFGPVLSGRARKLATSIDVAHVHHPFLSGWLVTRTCKPVGIPIVFTNHTRYDVYADVYAGWTPHRLRQWFVHWWIGRFLEDCDTVLAPSPEIAEWLAEEDYVEGARVLTNAVDVDRFAHPGGVSARGDLGFGPEDVVAVYLGRVGHEKRMLPLARAFVKAAGRADWLRLLVLGDGPAMDEFRQVLDDGGVLERVRFEGMVDPADVPHLLPAGDFFVTASTSDTFPLVVIEAMAAGLPAVGVDSPGVGEIITHERNGLLGDDESLAANIERIALDDELRHRLTNAAGEDAWKHDVNARVLDLIDVYEGLVDGAT